jgi:hypothetical protein
MISLFSVPKPFVDSYGIIQGNAVQSWLRLDPVPEIILCGDELGTSEICRKYNLMQIADIERNSYGTPLLNDVFEKVIKLASNEIICYINSDIIILPDFSKSLMNLLSVQKSAFLLTGNRWNLDIEKNIDFNNGWEKRLKYEVTAKGKLNRPGIDYFVFHKSLYKTIPPFALGRFSWDLWLAFEAHSLDCMVIDTTESMMAIHQNHDYPHLGLTKAYSKSNRVFLELNPEIQQNQKLSGWKIFKPTYKWYVFDGKKVAISWKAIIMNNYYTLRRILSRLIQRILLMFLPVKPNISDI